MGASVVRGEYTWYLTTPSSKSKRKEKLVRTLAQQLPGMEAKMERIMGEE